ncbi:MAG: (d)CMP kinase [Metamycoplasmataceae bacterium]
MNIIRKINIAIDGPSGVGKSTIAKNIASKINYLFINTGLMYRAISYFCIENEIDIEDEDLVVKNLKKINLTLLPKEQVILNNKNITPFLRSDKISISASIVAGYKEVRKFCVLKQQKYVVTKGIVMEGRDIGSVVIPDSELKIFLTATPEVRIKRRIDQLKKSETKYDPESVSKNIKKRDNFDLNRENDPLVKMPDAIEIDTSNISIEEVEDMILKLIKERTSNE